MIGRINEIEGRTFKKFNGNNKYYQYKLKTDNQEKNLDNFIKREENQKITIAEVDAILRYEENYFDKDLKPINKGKKGVFNYDKNGIIVKTKFDKRAKSSKLIKRLSE